jgi:polyphosphate glucokinase
VADIAAHFGWEGRIGCGFPAAIKNGVALTAANIDPAWIGTDGKALFEKATRCKVNLINDADAAGLAEMRFGAGRGVAGLVLMLTVGTGIGTALFLHEQLVPNTELGHIEIRGKDAERRASDAVRIRKELTWKQWVKRFNEFLGKIEKLLWPDLIIIGGGASRYYERFAPYLTVQARIVPAKLLNEAGIVGAALAGLPQPER